MPFSARSLVLSNTALYLRHFLIKKLKPKHLHHKKLKLKHLQHKKLKHLQHKRDLKIIMCSHIDCHELVIKADKLKKAS